MANVIIDIAAEFTGKKGFKQAETSTDKLSKGVKKLAGALGLAFGVAQVAAFGKASLKAFGEDEKAAARLTKAVENLGLGFEDARIKTFISDLEKTAGVSDDVLRPAFQSLLQTTGSVAKSQELLTLALDISAGSGVDAAEVSKDLSLAYLGQTKGLSKYNTGLTKAELNTASFSKIQATLNDQFAGQNAARLETYAGKMETLGVAAGNAKEIIGKGIVDALSMLGDDQSVTNLADNMTRAAESTADVIRGIGILAAKLKTIPGFDTTDWEYVYNISYLKFIKDLGAADRLKPKPFTTPMTVSGSTDADTKAAEARKKAEEEARKRALELLKIKNKQLDSEKKALAAKKLAAVIDKANLALNKGQDVFDLDKIQIAAALTNQAEQLGKATSASQALQIANDTARLNVKRSILALEDAIASKDEASIVAATNKLNADLKVLGALTGQSLKLSDIKSILESLKPVDLVNLGNLDAAIAKMLELIRLQGVKPPTTGTTGVTTGAGGTAAIVGMTAEDLHLSKLAAQSATNMTKPSYLNTPFDLGGTFNLEDVARSSLLAGLAGGAGVSGAVSGSRYAAQAANQYNVTIQANTIANPDELTNLIQNSLIQLNRRGDSLVQAGTL
jgi:hypothetical protein